MARQRPIRGGIDVADVVGLPAAGSEGELWLALLELADRQPTGWTLVGAMMVALHGYQAGRPIVRATRDLDAVVEVRGVSGGTATFVASLVDLGWELRDEDVHADEIGFRFTRGPLRFDVLAPEGLGRAADLTTLPPLRAVEVAGGTQALRRTHLVDVSCAGVIGQVPRPDLLGALVIKSCAAIGDVNNREKDPARHRQDLAYLYSWVDDPRQVAARVNGKDRRRLRIVEPLWEILGDARLEAQAKAARTLILQGA